MVHDHIVTDGIGGRAQDQVCGLSGTSAARSRSGRLSVITTGQGLPLAVRIDDAELAKGPTLLAEEILRLCRQSAMAAGIRLRSELIGAGIARDTVDLMGLPRPDDLAAEELRDDDEVSAPESWLRSL
ncbi:hypothetical protein [Gordonia sp. NPDC003376]